MPASGPGAVHELCGWAGRRLEVSKRRAAQKAEARAAWEVSQAAEAEEEAQRLRAERDAKRAMYKAAEEKLKQELVTRVEKEKQLLAERDRALAEERERKARCGAWRMYQFEQGKELGHRRYAWTN